MYHILLYHSWWKAVAVVFLAFVVIGGLVIPLGPAITKVNPAKFHAGEEVEISVKGYNTHFLESDLKLWIKAGERFYCGEIQEVVNHSLVNVKFLVPAADSAWYLSRFCDLVVNNKRDGTFTFRDAFRIVLDTSAGSKQATTTPACLTSVGNDSSTSISFPNRAILEETIRNLFFHVPMWFSMVLLLLFSFVSSIKYLSSSDILSDTMASNAVNVSILYGFMGLASGMLWAKFTWGHPWPNDPRLNGAAVGVLVYLAYIVLRNSISDPIRRAKLSSVYNIFAFVIYILFIFVIPRLTDSLHPGVGGNPAFSEYDLDNTMRVFFYPAVIGWSLIGFWLVSLTVRVDRIKTKLDYA